MAKAAPVAIEPLRAAGRGLLTVVARGDVAAVTLAVAAGADAAVAHGRVLARSVIGRPYAEVGAAFAPDPRPTSHAPPPMR
jgi:microcompartment protein CcmL/EutN